MATDYDDLPGLEGAENRGGFSRVLAAPKSWIDTIPAVVGGGAPGDKNKITGDITFVATKGFVELYLTDGTQAMTSEVVGERDGRTKKHSTTGFHPGNSAEKEEFFDCAQNEEWIVLHEECDTGKVWMLGDGCNGAELFASFTTGARDGSDRKGYTITIEHFGKRVFYEGTVTLKP